MKIHKKKLLYAVLMLVILGCCFRLSNLSIKPYWSDEVHTSIKVFGYTKPEMIQNIANGRIFNVEDIQRFQQPDSQKGVSATINTLIAEDAEITPLYFVIARVWAYFGGSSVAVMRLLPALFSLLSLPCIYWLCLELFESRMVGWGAVSLASISPLHILYAQESRNYGLWILVTLWSCACFLKALRTHRTLDWMIYGLMVGLSLYSCILSGVIIIAHGTYILIVKQFRQIKTIVAYLLASTLGFLTFTPWFLIFLSSGEAVNRAEDLTLSYNYWSIAKHWAGMISRLFVDFNVTLADEQAKPLTSVMIVLTSLILLLVGYSIYFLIHSTSQKVWLFVLLLLLAIPIILIPKSLSPDFPIRYLLPSFLAIQLAVAYTLSIHATKRLKYSWQGKFWRSVAVLVTIGGVASCTFYSLSDSWWNKYYNENNRQVADIINQGSSALVVSDLDGDRFEANLNNVMSFSYLLNPRRVKLQLVPKDKIPEMPKRFENVFALTPSQTMLQTLKKSGYTVVSVYKGRQIYRGSNIYLWKINSHTARDLIKVN